MTYKEVAYMMKQASDNAVQPVQSVQPPKQQQPFENPMDRKVDTDVESGEQEAAEMDKQKIAPVPAPKPKLPELPKTAGFRVLVGLAKRGADTSYTVNKGDTYWGIGKKFGVSPEALQAANKGIDPTKLQIGQKLTVPGVQPPKQYTIAAGDTMQGLDKRFKFPIGSFEKANPKLNYNALQIGQKINMPAVQPAAKAPVRQITDAELARQDAFYRAIIGPETGGGAGKYMRTKVAPKGGSTAYGPAQVTYTRLRQYMKNPELAEHRQFYDKTLVPMYENFIKYGRNPHLKGYDPRWDYGGVGSVTTPEQQKQFERLTKHLMKIDEDAARKALPNGSDRDILMRRIQMWRGVPYNEDKKYYDRVLKTMGY